MRILFIRHGDPNYELDVLTEQGKKEAKALASIIRGLNVGSVFVSPLGRARETASYSLKELGMEFADSADACEAGSKGNVISEEGTDAAPCTKAITYPWLREFPAALFVGGDTELQKGFPHAKQEDGSYGVTYTWDIMPAYVAAHPELMHPTLWRESAVAAKSDFLPLYDEVRHGFEALLASRGYVNQGNGVFRVEKESAETLTFFCHFGISSILSSILWGISPFVPLQFTCMLPTSFSELVTEEREQGTAMFRALRIGDQSHLLLAGLEPSFAARFREVYSDEGHRN